MVTRKTLWKDLQGWDSNSSWMIPGDFNSILSQAHKHNGEIVSGYETSYLFHYCTDLGLNDVNYIVCHFTWFNGKTWTKIDKVLMNHMWFSIQSSIHVHYDMSSRPFLGSYSPW